MASSGDQSGGQHEQNPPDLQLQALERMMRRIISDAIEPLASRMDKIDGGSHSIHDEVHGEIEVDQSPRQHTPRQGRAIRPICLSDMGERSGARIRVLQLLRVEEGEGPVTTWDEMKRIMRKRKPAPQPPLQIRERTESSRPKPPVADNRRGKQVCPNRRTMLMLESGEIESESEEDDRESPKETVQEEDDTLQSFETGEALVIKRSLTTQPIQDNQQRENIFHTRCLINNKVCVVIIDGGSCTNIASSVMVEKLGLKTTKHPNPYRLQWLNDGGEMKVTKQVLVPFTIGKYKDEVLCDVVAMGACHLLLGRPWKFDKGTLHDGVTNRNSFMHAGQKITLAPLTPSQVQEDQVHLRNNIEEVKKGKKRMNIYASNRDIRKCLSSQQSMLVLLFKNSCLLAEIHVDLPASVVSILQEFEDVFLEETPKGLSPLRGIEHQIDFIPGATLPNRPAYQSNPEETKELQK
ncbi:hypothetical protein V6N11_027758 [Hibiscus sabdariffa]|uniref:Uncharacterized protein n=1 Tax=Hibiscus sabdariffa TaxID=183260 RepID=A0ABR2NU63_9ROSI